MRILCLGDSPYLRTGFGVVNEVAVRELLALGHETVVVASQDEQEREPYSEAMTYIPRDVEADMMGWNRVPGIIERHKPDAVHIIGDPAMVATWLLHDEVAALPIVAYVPIEGGPMNRQWVQAFAAATDLRIVTTSHYGVGVLRSEGFDAAMAYHGVHSDFTPLTPDERAEWRERIGWSDRFVVMNVAQNVGRKQWPRLFEAIKIAAKSVPNLMLYAHTVPFNNYWLDGHDLPQLAEQMGIWDRVVFPPHKKHNDAVSTTATDDLNPGLRDLYGMADMFVLPSRVEGFGLPLAEAMAMGLPVAHTDYAAGAEVIGDAGLRLPVTDWEVNRSHSYYANVAPRDIAAAIVKVAKSPEYAKQLSRRSLARASVFTWDAYRAYLKEQFGAGVSHGAQDAQVHREHEAGG